jgi:hypothetical protein
MRLVERRRLWLFNVLQKTRDKVLVVDWLVPRWPARLQSRLALSIVDLIVHAEVRYKTRIACQQSGAQACV